MQSAARRLAQIQRSFTSTATMSSSLNHSGLTPEASKALKTRQPTDEERPYVEAVRALYSLKPTDAVYEHFTPEAVFHDPIGLAKGLDKFKIQFNSLPKLFEKTTIDKFNVLETPTGLPDKTIVIDQDVTYYRSADKPFKTINSLLTIERAASGKITTQTEEWNHSRTTDSSDGVLGAFNELRKKFTANAAGLGVSSDPKKI